MINNDLQPNEEKIQKQEKNNAWTNLQLPTDNVIIPESAKFKKKPRQPIYLEEDEYKTDRQLRLLADLEAKINSHKNKIKKTNEEPKLNEGELPKAEESNEDQKQQKITNIFEVLKESEEDYDDFYIESGSEKNKSETPSDSEQLKIHKKENSNEQLNEIHPVPISNNGKFTNINTQNIVKPVIHKPKKSPSRNKQKNNDQKITENVKESPSPCGRVSFCIIFFIAFCFIMLLFGCSDEIVYILKQYFNQ